MRDYACQGRRWVEREREREERKGKRVLRVCMWERREGERGREGREEKSGWTAPKAMWEMMRDYDYPVFRCAGRGRREERGKKQWREAWPMRRACACCAIRTI